MNNELKRLERKHGRRFPNLKQAEEYDRNNQSLEELKKRNEETDT